MKKTTGIMGHRQLIVVQLISVFSAFVRGDAISYRYLGCYEDNPVKRDLNGLMMTIPGLTVQQCASRCQLRGYAYAGLQTTNQCFCGSEYGFYGPSLNCNTTCSGQYCGGYLVSDVYYSVDARGSTMSQRKIVLQTTPKNFNDARMTCIMNNGDLTRLDSDSIYKAIVNATGGSVSAWIGLFSQDISTSPYGWTDETGLGETYLNEAARVSQYWDPSDPSDKSCVKFDASIKKMRSADCTTALPFICNQIPPPPPTANATVSDVTTAATPTTSANFIALLIVLPIFFLCYGGSCVIYCVYKIYVHCKLNNSEAKWKNLEAMTPVPPRMPRLPIIPYPFKAQPDSFPQTKMPPSTYPPMFPSDQMKKPVTYEGSKNMQTSNTVADRPASTASTVNMDGIDIQTVGAAAADRPPTISPTGRDSAPAYVSGDDGPEEISSMQPIESIMRQKIAAKTGRLY